MSYIIQEFVTVAFCLTLRLLFLKEKKLTLLIGGNKNINFDTIRFFQLSQLICFCLILAQNTSAPSYNKHLRFSWVADPVRIHNPGYSN